MASVDGEGGAVSEGAGTRDGQNVLLVHDRLRDAILRGEIAAGETASQVTLARDLEVGRTPLREALRMLQREGLVVSEPNRRVRIAGLSAADMEAITVMRIGLETVAVRITVPTLQSGQIAELEGYMAQMDHFMRVGDTSGMRPAHRAFHQLLVAGAGDRIAEMLGEWFDHAERYRLQYGAQTKAVWESRRAEHRRLLDAAAAGDAELASRRLAEHYAVTAGLVFAVLDQSYDPSRLRTALETVAPGTEAMLLDADALVADP